MKVILIIGSKGFIGKHCINYFMDQPDIEVHGCDVVVDYVSDNYHLIDASNSNYSKLFQSFRFDVCINCSGAASVPDSIKNPRRDYQLNTINVFKILDAIRQYNSTCKFLNLSSAAVYGNPQSLPISELHAAQPVSPYGYHKWQSEIICREMYELYGLKTCSLRIFSAYGEGLYKQLFWDLYQKSKKGKVNLWGTGAESRDFIHIKDIIQIIHLVIEKLLFEGDILNIGNGREIFIRDAVNNFYNILDKDISYEFQGQTRKGDPSNWVADVTKAKKIGYEQKIKFDKGLERYIEWLKELE